MGRARGGCANDIGIGTGGSVWMVGCASGLDGGFIIAKWNGSFWNRDTSGRGATRIAVDSSGKPWIVNNRSEIFYRTSVNPSDGGWQIVSGAALDIGIGPVGYPWVIGTTSTANGYGIWAWDDEIGNWTSVPPEGGTRISVGRNSRPWMINSNLEIRRAIEF